MEKLDILAIAPDELANQLVQAGYPKYRGGQIYTALHKNLVPSFDRITTLSIADREKLSGIYRVPAVEMAGKMTSQLDGTVKYLFRLDDGEHIESVLMRYKHGNSVCLSTQAGCRMGCRFCASTIAGFTRNLTAGEILGQVYAISRDSGERVSNIVLMGIGEPLDNIDCVLSFLHRINDENGLNIGYRHISLSTCGLIDGIERLMREDLPITLSISLHAPYDNMRSEMMPVNRKYPLEQLVDVCKRYCKAGNRRISYEYAMVSGVNDNIECAKKLSELFDGYQPLSHFNLIPVNPVKERDYVPAQTDKIRKFIDILESRGFAATIRRHLGGDIDASCGQLRSKYKQT